MGRDRCGAMACGMDWGGIEERNQGAGGTRATQADYGYEQTWGRARPIPVRR